MKHIDLTKNPLVKKIVALALEEDLDELGDITTAALIDPLINCRAVILANSDGILAGASICTLVFKQLSEDILVTPRVRDGSWFKAGDVLIDIAGPAGPVLSGERCALNFLQHLCGVATLASRYVKAVEGTKVKIYDTRKTLPGLRILEKNAVAIGGGFNHRAGLFDAVLIKDNHVAAAGGVTAAVTKAKPLGPVEVEVDDLDQLDEALAAGADIILLDNMDIETLRSAVERTGGSAVLEASGGITPENVRAVAETGVDRISVGAITQAAPPLDLSLEFSGEGESR